MATSYEYEAYKRYLQSLKLTPEEYEKKLKEWCKKINIREAKMERIEFLEMCQKISLLKSGVCGIKKDVPNELIVKFGNFRYYPVAYKLSFDNGEPVHTAILHDLHSNSITRVNLKDVKQRA